MNVHFDTLEYSNTLERAGIERPHAEAIAKVQVKALQDLVQNDLVTKDFLKSELIQMDARLRGELVALRTELKGDIAQLRTDLNGDMATLKTDLQAEIRKEGDALRLQLRSLQFSGAMAAFAITAVVLLSRLIK